MENRILRQAEVRYRDEFAGFLTETAEGYVFQYDDDFLKKNISVSVSLPPRKEPYVSKDLFPFFKGLLPEGWYLDIVTATQKVDAKDSFGVLLSTAGRDTVGAVVVRKMEVHV
jgi:serine/threonine-protein kinase HipA